MSEATSLAVLCFVAVSADSLAYLKKNSLARLPDGHSTTPRPAKVSAALADQQMEKQGRKRKEAKAMARAFPGVPFYAKYSRTAGSAWLDRHIKYESDGKTVHVRISRLPDPPQESGLPIRACRRTQPGFGRTEQKPTARRATHLINTTLIGLEGNNSVASANMTSSAKKLSRFDAQPRPRSQSPGAEGWPSGQRGLRKQGVLRMVALTSPADPATAAGGGTMRRGFSPKDAR